MAIPELDANANTTDGVADEIRQEEGVRTAVSSEERQDRLTQVLLGLVPLGGMVAAIIALLWREYWKDIGVRVTDLGVDPASRLIDVLVFGLLLLGLFGPLFFIGTWLGILNEWVSEKPTLTNFIEKGKVIRLGKWSIGKLVFSYTVAWILLATLLLSLMFLLYWIAPLILVLIIGSGVGILLLANFLGLSDDLPNFLRFSTQHSWRVITVIGVLLFIFMVILSGEILIAKPDIRTDGGPRSFSPESVRH